MADIENNEEIGMWSVNFKDLKKEVGDGKVKISFMVTDFEDKPLAKRRLSVHLGSTVLPEFESTDEGKASTEFSVKGIDGEKFSIHDLTSGEWVGFFVTDKAPKGKKQKPMQPTIIASDESVLQGKAHGQTVTDDGRTIHITQIQNNHPPQVVNGNSNGGQSSATFSTNQILGSIALVLVLMFLAFVAPHLFGK
jgi:hypothetical protein